ncbi:hypothetical protein [Thermicanus aegyptius]|uniref:hypothetical protein n=1 Tax=Thermicanus aegyptius TaxID=94009 RepID=UPI0003FD09E9|nr:hypothetical protein [Thermicanus aegyptius]
MRNKTQLRLHLTGGRFETQGIPLAFFNDLSVLGEMIIEVAKYEFLKDHPNRQRIPKGFTDEVMVNLSNLEKGSVISAISIEARDNLLVPPLAMDYYKKAIDSIVDAIYAANEDERITNYLPPELLIYFDRFGRTLREDEAIEFPMQKEQNKVAKLTMEIRKKLILNSRAKEITDEIQLRGTVPEVDQEANTFHIQLLDGSKIKAPIEDQYFDTIKSAFNSYREPTPDRILIQGIGRFNRQGKLLGIDSVEHVILLDSLDVPTRLEELSLLKDGWFDGEGKALDKNGIKWFTDLFTRFYPDELPLPYVFPTIEGDIRLEWSIGPYEASLELNLNSHEGYWHVLNIENDQVEERELFLDKEKDWKFISERIESMSKEGTHS